MTATYDDVPNVGSTLTVALNNGESLVMSNIVGSTITGTYTVGATDSGQDVTGLDVASITSQSVSDGFSNTNSSTGLPATTITTASSINVDTTKPALVSFTSSTADDTYGPTSVINVTATYDDTPEPGSTVDVTLDNGVSLTLNNIVGMTISADYTVGATGSGEDSLDLEVTTITAQNVFDPYGNTNSTTTLPGTNISDGSNIIVDTSAPVLQSFTSSTADETYGPLR